MSQYHIYPTLLDSFYWATRFNNEAKKKELIDKINKVPTPMPEAALKGVEFEGLINDLLDGKEYEINLYGQYSTKGFEFSKRVCDKVIEKLGQPVKKQEFVSAEIKTGKGDVKMYGFIDYSYLGKYVDLKTTGKYTVGKYQINHQHIAYPLIAEKNNIKIDNFEYVVTDFKDCYTETYNYNQEAKDYLIHKLECFIDWLEQPEIKLQITHPKIFGK